LETGTARHKLNRIHSIVRAAALAVRLLAADVCHAQNAEQTQ
jgi:hypothetical protein